jgi:hypothetical protein
MAKVLYCEKPVLSNHGDQSERYQRSLSADFGPNMLERMSFDQMDNLIEC